MTGASPAPDRGFLTEGAWDRLLDFLDPSRRGKEGPDRSAEAEARYLEMVRRLVCFFAGRGCRDAEDLAMESVLRVAAKCGDVDTSPYEDRTGYFYGVARNVLHEWWRDAQRESTSRESFRRELSRLGVPDPQSWRRKEAVHRCLDFCLRELSQRARRLVVSYYGEQGAAKIESHRRLADEFGKSVNALRIEVHRIRAVLRECVVGCMAPRGGLGPETAANG